MLSYDAIVCQTPDPTGPVELDPVSMLCEFQAKKRELQFIYFPHNTPKQRKGKIL